ncbi:MAG TPA: exodeoxyribonuclease V subunit gamma, partial [bacterium]
MPFGLFTSNRLENLVEKLAEALSQPLSTPLQPETIVVQSKGMERWLSLQLAERLGICANVRFPFPNTFLTEVGQKIGVGSKDGAPDLFAPEILTWRIMRILPQCLDQPEFAAPKRYLEGGVGDVKLIQLSARIADLFDQYLVFRPDMIAAWERGTNGTTNNERWQAALWRKLAVESEQPHRAQVGARVVETLRSTSPGRYNLPQRISVFGISTLPLFHLRLLDA